MIKIENVEVMGWEAAIRGMRNPKNSWDRSDSDYRPILCKRCDNCMSYQLEKWDDCEQCEVEQQTNANDGFMIGPNDLDLMTRLRNAGTDHRKFMRMITVYLDITAPLYWFKEFDTYKVGTVANSCSTMHKIADKEFTLEDFSCEHLVDAMDIEPECPELLMDVTPYQDGSICFSPSGVLAYTVRMLNICRNAYLKNKDKKYWWQMIQLLPTSYNQRRTVMLNYEVLANIYKSRRNHKLDEWHTFCDWIETLPYSQLITGIENKED